MTPSTFKLPQNTPATAPPPESAGNQVPTILHTRVVTGAGGGPEKTIFRTAPYANPKHYNIAAAYIHPENDPGITAIREHAASRRCNLFQFTESGPLDLRTVKSCLKLCRQLNVSVWHAHDYKTNLLGLLLRTLWPMKLVTTVHGWTWHSKRTRFYYHLDVRSLRFYDHVIVVNPSLANLCLSHHVKPHRLTYIPNGVELADYRRLLDRDAARSALGVQPNNFVIGVVGRLSSEKGPGRAIHALAQTLKLQPNIEMLFIGDGPEKNNLRQLAQKLGVSHAVRFLGWRDDSRPFYQTLDLLLLPSLTEGMPNAVLEAMAMNVPVAATHVGGVAELLDQGRCGVLLGQDHSLWPDSIASLLADPIQRNEFARRARTRVEQNYTFQQRMARETAIYDNLLGLTTPDTFTLPQPQDQQQQRRAA